MGYRYLSEELRPVADAAMRYFKNDRGASSFKQEKQVDKNVDYRPTLCGITRDHHYLCIEVSESPYPRSLDRFVLDCMNCCLPVKLFVALPAESEVENYRSDLARARQYGVGVIEISDSDVGVIHEALSLSLTGLRPIERKKFPRRYREDLAQAEATFRAGDPANGCLRLYQEIEAVTRRIAKKTFQKGLWRPPKPGEKRRKIDFDRARWATVTKKLMDHLDYRKCKRLSYILLARVLGITSHRNDSAHKPKTRAALIRRDKELRTRFENARDILFDLTTA